MLRCLADPTFAVVPVLVGPLQTLLALLPALLVAAGAFLAALFTPAGWRRCARFFWRQKLFSVLLIVFGASVVTGWPWRGWAHGSRVAALGAATTGEGWSTFRGGPGRRGAGADDRDPETAVLIWRQDAEPSVYSSPALAGDAVVVAASADLSPFNPAGRGAIVALDASTGRERWRYAPDDYRATFSSPVVGEGAIVCGEGLHQVQDARVVCLELDGRPRWEFRTRSHVEATPAIADGRAFVGAGADGFYAFDLRGDGAGGAKVLWHLDGQHFPDCESSPLVIDQLVIFGLGEGGQALCAASVADGRPVWRLSTPYPVFTSPTLLPATESTGAKLVVAMGNGNFVQSAEEIRERKLAQLREAGADAETLEETSRRLAPGGQVWCVDLETQEVEWRYLLDDTVLGSIAERDGRLYFGCRDGTIHCLARDGRVLQRSALHAPVVCSPAVGRQRVYVTTVSGRLFALDLDTLRPVWDASLGDGENFTSSPVVDAGRVFVGTQAQGIVCYGSTTGRLRTELWRRGETGGAVDTESPAEEVAVVARWPDPGERFEATAPLTLCEAHVVAAGRTGEVEQLVRLDCDPASGAMRVVWRTPAAIMDFQPPMAIGDSLLTLEYFNQLGRPDSHFDPARPTITWPHLVSRRLDTGQLEWRNALQPIVLRGWTGDARRVYLIGADRLMTFSVRDGSPGWTIHFGQNVPLTLALVDDLVLVADEASWRALDSDTGIELWRVAATEGRRTAVLDAAGNQLLAAETRSDGGVELQLRQALDGALVWRTPWLEGETASWGRLAAEQALVGAASGRWRVVRLADGSFVELDSDPAAASGDEPPAEVAAERAARLPRGALLFRSAVCDVQPSGLRRTAFDEPSRSDWLPLTDAERPVTPLVAVRGRVYFAARDGAIRCAGPRSTAP